MKELFLLRHAKSSWSEPALHDEDRPLNSRGKRQLGIMSSILEEHGALDAKIYASKAERAQQTISGIIAHAKTNKASFETDKQLYTFNRKKLLKWLQRLPDDLDQVLIVGHNPALEELLEYLLKVPSPTMPTCSFAHLQIDVNSWSSLSPLQSTLTLLVTPATASYKEFSRKARKNDATNKVYKEISLQEKLLELHHQSQSLLPGCKIGKDPEFLHQYRIVLRKTRALVEIIHLLTKDNALERHKLVLKQHSGITSELRDIEVFLQFLNIQKKSGSEEINKSKNALIKHINALHRKKQNIFVTHACSDLYSQDLSNWLSFLKSEEFRQLNNQFSTNQLASKLESFLAKIKRQIQTPELNEDDLHRIRKLVKKCSYICSAIEHSNEQDLQLVSQLQETLGRFQDICVQMSLLRNYIDVVPDKKLAFAENLLTKLRSEKNSIRSEIAHLF